MPGTPFSWTHSGNYPAGPNAWNGQPLSVAPAQRYFTPQLKGIAENFNEVLGEIADDSTYLHGAVGTYQNYQSYQYILPASQSLIPFSAPWSTTSVPNGTFPQPLATTEVSLQTIGGLSSPINVQLGDIVRVTLTGSILVGSNALPDVGQIGLGVWFIGTSTAAGNFAGSQCFGATDQPVAAGFSVTAVLPFGVGIGPIPGPISVALQYYVARNSGGTMSMNLFGPLTYTVDWLRPN